MANLQFQWELFQTYSILLLLSWSNLTINSEPSIHTSLQWCFQFNVMVRAESPGDTSCPCYHTNVLSSPIAATRITCFIQGFCTLKVTVQSIQNILATMWNTNLSMWNSHLLMKLNTLLRIKVKKQLVKSSYCNLMKFKFNAFRLT